MERYWRVTGCYRIVTQKLQENYRKLTEELQKRYSGVTGTLKETFRKATRELQKSYSTVIKLWKIAPKNIVYRYLSWMKVALGCQVVG